MTEVELGGGAFCILIAVGAVAGFFSLWSFERFSDAVRMRTAFNRILAHLLELRLFADEPALVIRAQRDLIAANATFLIAVSGPSLLLVFPFAILLASVDAVFAHAPLQLGTPAVVTVQWKRNAPSSMTGVQLGTPEGIEVETPPAHVGHLSQVSWRVRSSKAVRGKLTVAHDGHLVTKSISSAPGLQWLSPVRSGSFLASLSHPFEVPFSDGAVQSISVAYPQARIWNLSWTVWFLISYVAGGLAYLRY